MDNYNILAKLDESTLASIRRLKAEEDFQKFVKWLEASLEEKNQKLIYTNDGVERWRGVVAALDTLLSVFDDADSLARILAKGR